MREIVQTECVQTGEALETPRVLGWMQRAAPYVAQMVIDADTRTGDGRSEWFWVRMANGDLMLATFPQGETYMATEADEDRP